MTRRRFVVSRSVTHFHSKKLGECLKARGVIGSNRSNRAATEPQTQHTGDCSDDARDGMRPVPSQRWKPVRAGESQQQINADPKRGADDTTRCDRSKQRTQRRATQALREAHLCLAVLRHDRNLKTMTEPCAVPDQRSRSLGDRSQARGSVSNDVDETIELAWLDLAIDFAFDHDVERRSRPA